MPIPPPCRSEPCHRTGPGSRAKARLRAGICLSLALVALVPRAAEADIIVLKNGNEIQGMIVEEEGDRVTVRFPGGTLTLRRRQIHSIERQSKRVYLIEEAEKAILRKDYARAIEILEKAKPNFPDSDRLRLRLREARALHGAELVETNRFTDALSVYGKLLAERPGDREVLEEIANIREARGRVRAEVDRARREIREGDYETSLVRLRRIHAEQPDFREAISEDLAVVSFLRARKLLRARQWEEAADLFRFVLVLDPDRIAAVRAPFVKCILERIAPLVEAGDFEGVERLSRLGLEVDPSSAQLNYLLGLSLEARDEVDDAARIYASILGERPPPNRSGTADLRRRVEETVLGISRRTVADSKVLPGGFREIEGPYFLVRHRNEGVGREVSRVAESFYLDLFRRLGCQTHWRNPCEIVVHPDENEYRRSTSVGIWSGAAHQLTRRRGVFSEHRIDTFQTQPGLTGGVIQHEIAHALLVHRLNYPRNVPLWANEGFAVSEGPAYLKEHYRRLAGAARDGRRLIPLEIVLESRTYPRSDVGLFYAESFTLVDYLLRLRGLDTFVAFLKDLSGTTSLAEALATHYRIHGVRALENRWLGSF